MVLYLIRHGETDSNAQRVMQRPEDGLSSQGIAQATRLAERLVTEDIQRVISSHLTRAVMTAQCLVEKTGASLNLNEDLQERNFGDLRGMHHDDLPTDPYAPDYAPPGGESWIDFHARVSRIWQQIVRTATRGPGVTAVVTHALVLHAILDRHVALEMSLPDISQVARVIPNSSLTIVVDRGRAWHVTLLACTNHLSGEKYDQPVGI